MLGIGLGTRLKNAWSVFTNRDPTGYLGNGYGMRPDRVHLTRGNERSIVTAIYNRIALDVASVEIRHVRLDENGRYLDDMNSGLNRCLTLEANLDQTGKAFIQDVVLSLLDEGCIAIVPTVVDRNLRKGTSDILELRTGKILEWFPYYVRVRVYNSETGRQEEIVLPKETVGIIENPLYAVINDKGSIMARLVNKLALLDYTDEQSTNGKLNMILKLPYTIRTEARRQQALKRLEDMERQLQNSPHGIAYADGTEGIVQLNRSLDNNVWTQIEYLTSMLYGQLGITSSILDGTADEQTMLNYQNRSIVPFLSAITGEMKRKFLTTTARSQRQSVEFFRNPFELVPVEQLAEMADKLTRNEILTSNEVRQIIHMKPSDDPEADKLRNKNLSASAEELSAENGSAELDRGTASSAKEWLASHAKEEIQNGGL